MSQSSEHESIIKTPKQLITVVLASFIVPIIGIVLLVTFVAGNKKPSAGSDAFTDKAISARLKPIAHTEFKDPNAVQVLKTGEQVYKEVCTSCHAIGAAGAPKSGDTAAWAPRIKTGYEALLKSVINGKGAMQARAGNPSLSDVELGRAVVFMANAAGASFKEPAAPVAPVQAPAAPVAAASKAVVVAAMPVADTAVAAPALLAADAGKKLYETACMACHAAGIAGSPKFGDKAAWSPRLAAGLDVLTQHVITGKGAMPAKGGSAASDAEIKAAVQFMLAAVK